jgi:nitrous oxide reductase accessory protein NosL
MIFRNIIIACFLVLFISPQVIAHEAKRDECIVCGMWIDQYMKTRHVVVLKDGQLHSFCSFACAAKYYNEHKAEIKEIKAADFQTEKLIDAQTAYYLEGSTVPGVMSYTSRIAFEKKSTAEKFKKKKGGRILDFRQALKNQLEGK